jgi:hypothetical protein
MLGVLAVIGTALGLVMGAKGLWEAGAFLSVRRDSHRRLQLWQHVAASCRLRVKEVSSASARRLKVAARAGSMAVRIEGARGIETGLEIAVAVPGPPGFSEVRLRRESWNPLPRVQEIGIGDERFDRTFYCGGPMRLVCALLDAEMRDLLVSVSSECRLELVDGELRAETSDRQLASVLPRLVALGRRLSRPMSLALRLARNARRDPAAGVRLQNLILLVRESPGDPRMVKTLRRACSDSSPKIRLWAARELGAEGREVLLRLAESEADDDCGAQAVSALGPELPFETTRAILVQALRGHRVQTARACLEALGRGGTAAAEPLLIQALRHETAEVRLAAANGLGRLGSATAVLPLQEAAGSFSHDLELVRATRQAIAEIQSRLPGASPGQLSLDAVETGQLSLAAESGELSLAPDPAGQLSLPPEEPET